MKNIAKSIDLVSYETYCLVGNVCDNCYCVSCPARKICDKISNMFENQVHNKKSNLITLGRLEE